MCIYIYIQHGSAISFILPYSLAIIPQFITHLGVTTSFVKEPYLYLLLGKKWHYLNGQLSLIYIIPPKRSATAPVRRPPTVSTTRMSELEETLAMESRRDNVSTRRNLNH